MKVLLSEAELERGVGRLADEIRAHYGDTPLTVVAVMTGALVLLADLIRRLEMPLRVGVISASSYRGGTTSGELKIETAMLIDIEQRDVLIVDDIFDTGKTLASLVDGLLASGAKSVRTAVLLRKSGQQEVTIQPDFIGFDIPNEFVVGYGLDYYAL